MQDSALAYKTGVEGLAIANGFVYRGKRWPQLQGRRCFWRHHQRTTVLRADGRSHCRHGRQPHDAGGVLRDHDDSSRTCAGARPVESESASGLCGAGRPGGPGGPCRLHLGSGLQVPGRLRLRPDTGRLRVRGTWTCHRLDSGWASGWTWGHRLPGGGPPATSTRVAHRNGRGRRDLHPDEGRRLHPSSHEHPVTNVSARTACPDKPRRHDSRNSASGRHSGESRFVMATHEVHAGWQTPKIAKMAR